MPRFLLRQGVRFHDVAENSLVALHCQLDMAAQVVARFSLLRDAPVLCNGLNMRGSLIVARLRTDGGLVGGMITWASGRLSRTA